MKKRRYKRPSDNDDHETFMRHAADELANVEGGHLWTGADLVRARDLFLEQKASGQFHSIETITLALNRTSLKSVKDALRKLAVGYGNYYELFLHAHVRRLTRIAIPWNERDAQMVRWWEQAHETWRTRWQHEGVRRDPRVMQRPIELAQLAEVLGRTAKAVEVQIARMHRPARPTFPELA